MCKTLFHDPFVKTKNPLPTKRPQCWKGILFFNYFFHIFISLQTYISSKDKAKNLYMALKFTSVAYVILQVKKTQKTTHRKKQQQEQRTQKINE